MPYLSLSTLAERFGVTVPTLSRLAKRGDFPKPLRIGRQYRFAAEDVAEWERRQRALDSSVPGVTSQPNASDEL